MDYNIEFVKESREQWLKYIPTVINRLAKDYNFYYSGNINKIKKDILDIIKENYDKNRHKIVLYQTSDKTRLFLVVYAKKRVSIYYCTEYEYKLDENNYNRNQWTAVKRFMKKFDLAYKEAVKWKETQSMEAWKQEEQNLNQE